MDDNLVLVMIILDMRRERSFFKSEDGQPVLHLRCIKAILDCCIANHP
jgi:hypothetical protein